MTIRVVGAGLPRTGTSSQRRAIEHLLSGRCMHMSAIEGHPFNLGLGWQQALDAGSTDWAQLLQGYVAAVDWPASMFWRELSEAFPDALVLLSVRESPEQWWQSMNKTVLEVGRMALAPDWKDGRDLVTLLERFTGTDQWDAPAVLMATYERHNALVRHTIPQQRLLEWHAVEGWAPICQALGVPVPTIPFPHLNKREDWE